jgi:glucosamine-6-phosphate deaminase
MVIHVHEDAGSAAMAVSALIREAVERKPNLVLGLAAGRTPLPVYAELTRQHAAGRLDCSQLATFNLDEFVGVDAAHPGSFRRFMQEHLFAGVNLVPSRTGFLDGMAADTGVECERYEGAIAAAGGIDLQLLGIGTNGHIGFNEPGEHLIAATHVTRLLPATRAANAALFDGDVMKVPELALTMGMRTILSARRTILVAFGDRKAPCIERMVRGPVTTRVPASFLQLHADVKLFLDRGAAARLA